MQNEIFLPKYERLSEKKKLIEHRFYSPNIEIVVIMAISQIVNKKIFRKQNKSKKAQQYQKSLMEIINFSYYWVVRRKLLILAGDVETNPGPGETTDRSGNQGQHVEIQIITYNARGLKDKLKLKRILNKCYGILKKKRDTFFFFQETHLGEECMENLKFLWRHGVVVSHGVGRQGGSMILYDESWEVIKTEVDDGGRLCLLSVKKYNQQICFCNIYAPNDHSLTFFSNVYESLANHSIDYPGVNIIIGGDFNLVMGQNDMINRSANNAEVKSRDFIKEQNTLLELKDCYRINNATGGFTWTRGNCMSRLDMIFASKTLIKHGVRSKIDWGFDTSDHAMVEIQLKG